MIDLNDLTCCHSRGLSVKLPRFRRELSLNRGRKVDHVLKGGLGRITENIAAGEGAVIFSMLGIRFGFGIVNSIMIAGRDGPDGIVVLFTRRISGSFWGWKIISELVKPVRRDYIRGYVARKTCDLGFNQFCNKIKNCNEKFDIKISI